MFSLSHSIFALVYCFAEFGQNCGIFWFELGLNFDNISLNFLVVTVKKGLKFEFQWSRMLYFQLIVLFRVCVDTI